MRTFSDHCAYLGCPLSNVRSSWSAISRDGKRALFTIWAHEVRERKFILYPTAERRPRNAPELADQRYGAAETGRLAERVLRDKTISAFGILCFAKDPKAQARERKDFDGETVFRLRIEQSDEMVVAHLVERVPIEELVSP